MNTAPWTSSTIVRSLKLTKVDEKIVRLFDAPDFEGRRVSFGVGEYPYERF